MEKLCNGDVWQMKYGNVRRKPALRDAALSTHPALATPSFLLRVTMLYADKRNLEGHLQVALLRIRNKELQFYADNLGAIGTQAALLSGFAYNAIIMTAFPPDANEVLKSCFLLATTCSMSLELMTVGASMIAAIQGPGLALRGTDGSMHRAVDGMLIEYKIAFLLFATGLCLFILAALLFAIIQYSIIISITMTGGMLYFSYDLFNYFQWIYARFSLTETVTGRFEFTGTGAAVGGAVPGGTAASPPPPPPPPPSQPATAGSSMGGGKARAASCAQAGGGGSGAAAAALAAAHAKIGASTARIQTPRRMY